MQWVLLVFPWLELWSLIELGGAIGGFTALIYVFATLLLGLGLIHGRGIALLRKLQAEHGRMVAGPQLLTDETAMIGAGLLFIVPGLITDSLAIVCLLAPLRRCLLAWLGLNPPEEVHRASGIRKNGLHHSGDTLEGDFHRVDD